MIIFTPNTVIKSTEVNSNFSESLDVTKFTNNYRFSVYRNAAWNVANNAYAKVVFDTELFDSNNDFATGTYTAPVAGYYQFNACISMNTVTGAGTKSSLWKNGGFLIDGRSGVEGSGYTGPFPTSCPLAAFIKLSAGDKIDIYGYSAGQAGQTGSAYTYFNGYFVCS
jgi:hypothetical protein